MTVSTITVAPSEPRLTGTDVDLYVSGLDHRWEHQTEQPHTALNRNTDLVMRLAESWLHFEDAWRVLDAAWEVTQPASYVDDFRTAGADGEYVEVRIDRVNRSLIAIGDARRPFLIIQFTA